METPFKPLLHEIFLILPDGVHYRLLLLRQIDAGLVDLFECVLFDLLNLLHNLVDLARFSDESFVNHEFGLELICLDYRCDLASVFPGHGSDGLPYLCFRAFEGTLDVRL